MLFLEAVVNSAASGSTSFPGDIASVNPETFANAFYTACDNSNVDSTQVQVTSVKGGSIIVNFIVFNSTLFTTLTTVIASNTLVVKVGSTEYVAAPIANTPSSGSSIFSPAVNGGIAGGGALLILIVLVIIIMTRRRNAKVHVPRPQEDIMLKKQVFYEYGGTKSVPQ